MLNDMSPGLWMFYVFKIMSDKGNVEQKVCLQSRKCENWSIDSCFFFFFYSFLRMKEKKINSKFWSRTWGVSWGTFEVQNKKLLFLFDYLFGFSNTVRGDVTPKPSAGVNDGKCNITKLSRSWSHASFKDTVCIIIFISISDVHVSHGATGADS